MKYEQIDRRLLFGESYSEMSLSEAEKLLSWLKENSMSRIEQLQFLADQTSSETVHLDYSVDSLIQLGTWLSEIIETRPLSQSEFTIEEERLPDWVQKGTQIPEVQLTEKSISICFDTAIYFSNVLLNNHSELSCSVHRGKKIDANRNQPIIAGFKFAYFNPYRVVAVGLVTKFRKDKYSPTWLHEIYHRWVDELG